MAHSNRHIEPLLPAAAAGAYELPGGAEPGAYVVIGVKEVVRDLKADAGTYTLTGFQAQLPRGFTFNAAPGVYTLSGRVAQVVRDLKADSGVYTLTGVKAQLVRDLKADPGAYALTGVATQLPRGFTINAQPGAYAITGRVAQLARDLKADPGAYALSGVDAGLALVGLAAIEAEPGSYTLTGRLAHHQRGLGLLCAFRCRCDATAGWPGRSRCAAGFLQPYRYSRAACLDEALQRAAWRLCAYRRWASCSTRSWTSSSSSTPGRQRDHDSLRARLSLRRAGDDASALERNGEQGIAGQVDVSRRLSRSAFTPGRCT